MVRYQQKRLLSLSIVLCVGAPPAVKFHTDCSTKWVKATTHCHSPFPSSLLYTSVIMTGATNNIKNKSLLIITILCVNVNI